MAQTTSTASLTPQSFYQSTLSGSITASDTTIPINSLPTANEGYLVLESTSSTAREIIHYTSKTGSAVVCGAVGDRGLFGTTAQAHSSGALVEDNWVTGYWLDLQSQVATTSATTLQRHLANPTEGQFGNNFVSSGYGITGASSSLVATLASGIAYVAGSRVLAAVGGHTYQAASDTFVDVNSSGSLTFAGATSGNSGASVPITSNSIRLARVNTHATGINQIFQNSNVDAAGNNLRPKGAQLASNITNDAKFSAYLSAAQNATGGSVFTKVALDTENFDTGSNFDSTTNRTFTAPIAGFYFFSGAVNVAATSADSYIASLFKNGVESIRGNQVVATSSNMTVVVSGLMQLVANDTVDLRIFNGAAAAKALATGSVQTYLHGFLVSAS